MRTNDPEFGSKLRRRQSPKFAAKQRRSEFWALVLGVVMGLVTLVDALCTPAPAAAWSRRLSNHTD